MLNSKQPTRKVFIRTYGCQMNVYDSDRMIDVLAEDYSPVDAPENADLILLNTSHIREKAAEKVYSELGKMRLVKESAAADGRRVTIGVTGCVAQAEGREIARRAKTVSLVVGPQAYHRLPELLGRVEAGERVVEGDLAASEKFAALEHMQTRPGRQVSAFLTVQEGCDKFCTFCVVPYTRGVEVSRPVAKIVTEVERLADAGVREVTLIGQNVNAYHGAGPGGRDWTLARLLHRIAGIPGIARLRYTTSHPRDMSEDLIAAHNDLPALMPHLHLPVQSGSDRILAAMNRRHTRSDYLAVIDRLRAARPDLALSSDFIIGFPGETEQDFGDTLALVDEVGYASAFSFKYSPRPGTPGAELPDQVPEPEKEARLAVLQAAIERHRQAFNAHCLGATFEVLFEKPGRHPGQLVGRSPYLQPVQVIAPATQMGELASVIITQVGPNSLFGALAQPDVAAGARLPAAMAIGA